MSNRFEKKAVRNTFERMIILTLIALFLAAALISAANDIFAFIKPDTTLSLNITESTSLYDIAKELKKANIISNPTLFSLFVRMRGKAEKLESFVGSIDLSGKMSYREIMISFL